MGLPVRPIEAEADDDSDNIGPLGFLQPRETKRVAKALAPRRAVLWLRIGLPVVAAIVLGILMLWPVLNPNKLVGVAINAVPDFVIQSLHFTGFDSKNQPYILSAAKATRPAGMHDIYDLDKPEGELTLANGSWVAARAQYGRFDQGDHKLWLGGNVQLFHDNGNEFTSDEAQIDMKQEYAWGDKPVLIQGGFGEIRGQGFRMLDKGQTMVVKGPAHAILNLHTTPASDKPAPAR